MLKWYMQKSRQANVNKMYAILGKSERSMLFLSLAQLFFQSDYIDYRGLLLS